VKIKELKEIKDFPLTEEISCLALTLKIKLSAKEIEDYAELFRKFQKGHFNKEEIQDTINIFTSTKEKWEEVSKKWEYSPLFTYIFQDFIIWSKYSEEISSRTIMEFFKDKINWENLIFYNSLSNQEVQKYFNYICWDTLSLENPLNDESIDLFKDHLFFEEMSYNTRANFSKEILFKYRDKFVFKDEDSNSQLDKNLIQDLINIEERRKEFLDHC